MRIWRRHAIKCIVPAAFIALAFVAFVPNSSAQQTGAAPVASPQQSPPTTDSSQQPNAQQSGAAVPSSSDSEKNRLAVNPVTGLVTSSALNYSPLTGKERLKVYWIQTYFSVGAYFRPVFFALALDQTTDSPYDWGGGFHGFGLRVASRTASNIVQSTIRAPLAAALHEDVRYVYSGRRGIMRRLLHATEYSLLTYNDSGNPTMNFSKLAGYYGSTAISTEWRPGKHSVPSYTLINGSEQLGLSIPTNVLQEFWPDITRKLSHRK